MSLVDNVVSGDINEYSITLYGQGGSGKSTFANALKRKLGSSVSFFFEPRAKGLGGIKVVECFSWDVFKKYIDQLRKLVRTGKKVPFDNIIIDSVDSAYDKCTQWVLEENDWETLQGDYGARYAAVGTEFKNAINTGTVKEQIDQIKQSEILVLDDIGAEQQSPWIRDDVLQVILQYRMQENLLTFFTSNLDFKGLEEHFAASRSGDETWQAKRVMERIRYLAREIHLQGDNRR